MRMSETTLTDRRVFRIAGKAWDECVEILDRPARPIPELAPSIGDFQSPSPIDQCGRWLSTPHFLGRVTHRGKRDEARCHAIRRGVAAVALRRPALGYASDASIGSSIWALLARCPSTK